MKWCMPCLNLLSMTEPVYTFVEEIAFQLFWVSLILCLRNHQRKPCAHVAFNWTWFWALNSQRATYIHMFIAISFVFLYQPFSRDYQNGVSQLGELFKLLWQNIFIQNLLLHSFHSYPPISHSRIQYISHLKNSSNLFYISDEPPCVS